MDLPVDDLKSFNARVEQAKTQIFGQLFFVADPYWFEDLRDSVVAVSNDGSNQAQHLRNIFTDTDWTMRVI